MVAQRITAVPGSSRSFLGGAVVYSNQLKIAFANVAPEIISQHGAVSEEVAKALALGIRQRTGATIGLGITGVAGPAAAPRQSRWAWSTSPSPTPRRPSVPSEISAVPGAV